MRALEAWISGPEPLGWHRNPTTGRRRIPILGGDVESWFEYVAR